MTQEDEARQVALVVERLAGRYPERGRDSVVAVVREVHAGFTQSPVRDFVPLLVERGARTKLSAEHAPADRSLAG